MENKVVGAESEAAFEFSAEGGDGFFMEGGVGSGEVDEVAGVNHEWLEIVFAAEKTHRLALWVAESVRRPLARARGENLEGVTAKPIDAFGGVLDASGDGSVDADAAGGEGGRLFRRRPLEGIFFGWMEFSHLIEDC